MIKEIEDFDINNFELKDLYESLIGAFIDLSFKLKTKGPLIFLFSILQFN